MRRHSRLSLYELVLLPMLGVLMYVSKLLMEFLPNIHLVGMFIMVFTLTFRYKALIPVYIYAFLVGVFGGFTPWWVPNLYIWTLLWGVTMLLPWRMPRWLCAVLYPAVCALFGFAFGSLWAPAQALLFGLSFEQMLGWIVTGLPYDALHGVGNLLAGLLILPLTDLVRRLNRTFQKT